MHKSSTLDPLLSRSVQEILAALLLERNEPWYLSDLAKRLGRSPSTLQRPLAALVRAGIVRRWADGNRVYFAPDPQCPILPELRGMLAKSIGLVDVLREELRGFAKSFRAAFVHGSIATGRQRSASDVDLLVIGSVTLADLAPALARAEKRLGRPVNATVFSPQDFAQRIARKNHFLQSVLAKEKIFVAGTPHDLEEFATRRPRRAARHEQIRAR